MCRRFLPLCLPLAAALLALTSAATAADDDPRPVTVKSEADGFPIVLTYYPAKKDANPTGLENAPVVILIHGEGGSRLIWDKSSAPPGGQALSFAPALHKFGYAVATVDMRKHGDSVDKNQTSTVEPNDYAKMVADLAAVKKFLVSEHEAKKLNINKLAIVAADNLAAVALSFAEYDWRQLPHLDGPGGTPGTPKGQDVRALVLLSPTLSAGKANARSAMNFLKAPAFGVGFLFIVGSKDTQDRNATKQLYQVAANLPSNADRVILETPNTNARGTDLMGNPAARPEAPIGKFLDEHVKKLKSEWQTRKSRYERDTP